MCGHINVGIGSDLSIKALANLIKKITQYKGNIEFDRIKPDTMEKKLLNNKKILSLGLKPKHFCVDALQKAYKVFFGKENLN